VCATACGCLRRRRARPLRAVGTESPLLRERGHGSAPSSDGSGARVRTSTRDSKGPGAAVTPPPNDVQVSERESSTWTHSLRGTNAACNADTRAGAKAAACDGSPAGWRMYQELRHVLGVAIGTASLSLGAVSVVTDRLTWPSLIAGA